MHRRLEEWIKTQPPDRDPRRPDLTGLNVTPIPGRAGDLLIWNRLLPHGNGHNVSDKPRLAQFITMFPVPADAEAARKERIRLWLERLPPPHPAFPGDPRQWEQKYGKTAVLTPLGRKLLGVDEWE